MSNENTEHDMESRPDCDHLEDWLRDQVRGGDGVPRQGEVGATVGVEDSNSGYRNGHAPAEEADVCHLGRYE